MTSIFWFAYITAYSYNGEQFSAWAANNRFARGVETRIIDITGPDSPSEASCKAYADARRKAMAKELPIKDYMVIKFECIPIQMPTK